MVSAMTAEATAYGVNIKNGAGQTIRVLNGNLADRSRPHGINTDDAEELVERAGYVAGTWRWQGNHFKTVVVPRDHPRFTAARAQGEADEKRVRLEIARTGKRPSGKPLTPEMQQWVRDYRNGRRDF